MAGKPEGKGTLTPGLTHSFGVGTRRNGRREQVNGVGLEIVVMQIVLTAGPDSRRKLRFRLVCGPSRLR